MNVKICLISRFIARGLTFRWLTGHFPFKFIIDWLIELIVIILMVIAVQFNLKMRLSNPSKVKSDLIKLRQCGMKRTSKVSLKGLIVSRWQRCTTRNCNLSNSPKSDCTYKMPGAEKHGTRPPPAKYRFDASINSCRTFQFLTIWRHVHRRWSEQLNRFADCVDNRWTRLSVTLLRYPSSLDAIVK